jgi:DNA-3-methyladenine glycosylase I
MQKQRCPWVGENKPFYEDYHDQEWGREVHDDRHHFELICLEGAQAGLSWETILKKRDNYRKLFYNFDPSKVAELTEQELYIALQNPGIVRNRLKVFSMRNNARVFLRIQQEYGSFDQYIWQFVGGRPIVNNYKSLSEVPASTPESEAISKDLKKRGMSFVGSTIIYAYMQAAGLVDDHLADCWVRQ